MEDKKVTLRLPEEVYKALRDIKDLDEYVVQSQEIKRISVILPLDLHERIKVIADEEGLTMNALIISYLNSSMK